jgi:hypothetical protein
MIGQRLAGRLDRSGTIRLGIPRCRRRNGSLDRLHLLQLEFKLIKLQRELLALPAEEHTPQLLDDQLQMFDLLCVREHLSLLLSEFFSLLRQLV